MLEKFTKILKDLKSKKENELMTFSLDTVQNYFQILDYTKVLKFNSLSISELELTKQIEENIYSTLEKLYVPDYQSKNV